METQLLFYATDTSREGFITKNKIGKMAPLTVLNFFPFSFFFLLWSMTFFSLFSLSLAFLLIHILYLAYISHMQLADGFLPRTGACMQIHSPNISSHPRPISLPRRNLWSQFYGVQFDFCSHVQMFAAHVAIRQISPAAERACSLCRNAPPQQALQIPIWAIHYNMSDCCPFREIDTVLGTVDHREMAGETRGGCG